MQLHESVIWTLMGHFDSMDVIRNRRSRRSGCMIATPWRLLFVSISKHSIQLESIQFSQIHNLDVERRGLFTTMTFTASGNDCRLRCWFNQPVRENMYWLRQRVQQLSAPASADRSGYPS